MPCEEETCRKWHGQPFMRVESNRIGLLNSANQGAVPVREKHCGAIRAINVEPDVVAATNFVNPRYVVDRPRAGGSGCSYDAKWFLAGLQVIFDCGIELLHVELQAFVYRNSTQGPPSKAEQARGFVQGMVSFHRGVEDRLSAYRGEAVLDYVREVRGERHGQGTEIRFIAAGCEGSTGCTLPSHQLANPANGFRLDSGSGLRPVQTGELRIERGDQGLGEERHVGRRGIHHSKIVCAGNVEPVVDQFTADLVENLSRVFPGLREPAKTGRINPVLGGGLNWTIGQRSEKPVYHFYKLVTEFAARL